MIGRELSITSSKARSRIRLSNMIDGSLGREELILLNTNDNPYSVNYYATKLSSLYVRKY